MPNKFKYRVSHRCCEHGGLKSKHGGAWGEFKIPSKNTSEGVHLIVKLPAISLQASKFTKNELLQQDFKLLFIVAFSGNHFMGVSCFNGRVVFQMGGFIFILRGGVPHGGTSVLVCGGGVLKKIVRWGVAPSPLWETLKYVIYLEGLR